MKSSPAVEKNDTKRRDGALPSELRDLEKLIHAFAEEFSFARDEVDRLKKKTASAIAAWHLAEARHRQEHHQTRARLNTLFNGRIERWIYASDDDEMKTFFRRVWRDLPPVPANGAAKQPRASGGVPAIPVKAAPQLQGSKENQPS
jgi:hypothetical protein